MTPSAQYSHITGRVAALIEPAVEAPARTRGRPRNVDLTSTERAILTALCAGPVTMPQLLKLARCPSQAMMRRHMSNIRRKLPVGGIQKVTAYHLTGAVLVAAE